MLVLLDQCTYQLDVHVLNSQARCMHDIHPWATSLRVPYTFCLPKQTALIFHVDSNGLLAWLFHLHISMPHFNLRKFWLRPLSKLMNIYHKHELIVISLHYMASSASGQDGIKSCAVIGYPRGARWSYLVRSGLPVASRKKNFPESHIINLNWPSLFGQDGWILTPSRFINTQKMNLANIQPFWPHTQWSIVYLF